jgi:hypothetical protein
MKGVINFFNIIIVPFSILMGFVFEFKYMWLIIALYSSLMLVNITINTIVTSIIEKKYEESYSAFWRTLFVIISAISWTFVIYS